MNISGREDFRQRERKEVQRPGFPSAAGKLEGEATAQGDFVPLGFKVSERLTSQTLKVF